MRYKILTIFTFLSVLGYGQIDTLSVNFGSTYPYLLQLDSLPNYKGHLLSIDLINEGLNLPYDNSRTKKASKKFKREVQAYMSNVNKRLPEVKVLYILHPTANGQHNQIGNEPIDSMYAPIYRIDFTKLTSLEVIYIIGDDTDYIVDFPYTFYNTPVKIIHCAQIAYYDKLKQNVQRKNKNINVLQDTQEEWERYFKLLQ
jgi:hypothetical protein